MSACAILIDYENLLSVFATRWRMHDPEKYSFEVITGLQQKMAKRENRVLAIQRAYADFEQIQTSGDSGLGRMTSLLRLGIDPIHAIGGIRKNAADIRLMIDAIELVYDRPEIDTIVLLAGDVDYLGIVHYLQKKQKHVILVSFTDNLARHLSTAASAFINAEDLLAPETATTIRFIREEKEALRKAAQRTEAEMSSMLDAEVKLTTMDLELLQFIIHHYGHHREIFFGAVKRRLCENYPQLPPHVIAGHLQRLERDQVYRTEMRHNAATGNEGTVILLNYDHDEVIRLSNESRSRKLQGA